jgi:hypothetical protein
MAWLIESGALQALPGLRGAFGFVSRRRFGAPDVEKGD